MWNLNLKSPYYSWCLVNDRVILDTFYEKKVFVNAFLYSRYLEKNVKVPICYLPDGAV